MKEERRRVICRVLQLPAVYSESRIFFIFWMRGRETGEGVAEGGAAKGGGWRRRWRCRASVKMDA
jgi:hypothetical protein